MKIDRVTVTYGELRSLGPPHFSNKKHEVTLSAQLQEGERPRVVKDRLQTIAVQEVRKAFGDSTDPEDEMDQPLQENEVF